MLHAHLIAVGMKIRHFRNGVELPPLIEDENYDFNFQETRHLLTPRIITPVKMNCHSILLLKI